MKLFILIAIGVYFVQSCFAGTRTLNEDEIKEIRTGLEGVSGIETKSIESIVDTLKKYRNDPTVFLSLALQGDTCTKNNIDVKHIVAVATNKSDEEIIAKYNARDMPVIEFTDDQLNVIEADLNKYHSLEKVKHAMKILRGLQDDTPEATESTVIEMLTSATKAVTNGCPTENSPNNQL